MSALIPQSPREVAPGAIHLPGWLDLDMQRTLIAACREWAKPPAGLQRTRLPNGGMMSVQSFCLGWHWEPYRYVRTTPDGAQVKPFPDWLGELGRRAVTDTGLGTDYRPDVALVNFYDNDARMGMHQDKEERSPAPVVSFSIGDTCLFRFGNTENRGKPYTDIELESGDLFVFGGESRMAYHGVPKTRPGTADPDLRMATGRLNITLREFGLTD